MSRLIDFETGLAIGLIVGGAVGWVLGGVFGFNLLSTILGAPLF